MIPLNKHSDSYRDKKSDSSDSDDKKSDSSDEEKSESSDDKNGDSSDDDTKHINQKKRDEQSEVSSIPKKISSSDDKYSGFSYDQQSDSSDDGKSDSSSDDDAKHISLKNVDDYLEQVGLLGENQQITKKDTSAAFEKVANGKNTVTLEQFEEILKDIADSKNLNVEDLKKKLKSVLPEITIIPMSGAPSGGMSTSKEPRAN